MFDVLEQGWLEAHEAGLSPGLPTHRLTKLAIFCKCKEVGSTFCVKVLKAFYNGIDQNHSYIGLHQDSGIETMKALQNQDEVVVLQETTDLDVFLKDMVRELGVHNVNILVDPLNHDGRMKSSIFSFTKSSLVENIKILVFFHKEESNLTKHMLEVLHQTGAVFIIGDGAGKIFNNVSTKSIYKYK